MRRFIFILLLLGAFVPGTGRADLVSPYGGESAPNFAELIVLEDRVRVVLEIDRADFPLFVAPDDGSGASLAERTGRTIGILADGASLTPQTLVVDLRACKPRRTASHPSSRPVRAVRR